MKSFKLFAMLAFYCSMCSAIMHSSIMDDIEKANKKGKTVFLVITGNGVTEIQKAMNIAKEANDKAKNSTVLQMNRDDQANIDFVNKYQLSTAPLPLILVIASNGLVTGGYIADQSTSDMLVALIPSPKKANVLQALRQGKAAFIVVSKKSMTKMKDVLSTCASACAEMENKAKVIEIDADDANEKTFLTELKVNLSASEPQTYVVNAQGQLTGTLSGIVDSKTLVASATKKVSSGCCPPGSGKSCPPPKK